MTLKDARPFITTSVFGAAFVVTALTCAARNAGTDTGLASMQSCIQDRFVENGSRVVSASPDAAGMRVMGEREHAPSVTIFSRKSLPPEIRLGDSSGRFGLQNSIGSLTAIGNLADSISRKCLVSSRPVHAVRRAGAEPSPS